MGMLGWETRLGTLLGIMTCELWGGSEGCHAHGGSFQTLLAHEQLGCHGWVRLLIHSNLHPFLMDRAAFTKAGTSRACGMLTQSLRLLSQGAGPRSWTRPRLQACCLQLLLVSHMPVPQGALKISQWLIAFLKITTCKVLCWGEWLLKLDTLESEYVCVYVCM